MKRESAGASIADSLVVIPQARVMRTPRDAASYFARVSPIVGRCMAADVAKKGFVVTAVRRRDVAGTAPMASGWRISYHTPARGRIAARFTVDYTFQCRGRACLLTIVAGAAAERGNTGPIASSVQKANAGRLASVFP